MRLGEILLARGLVSAADIEEAARRQKTKGGRLGDNLIGLGVVTREQLDEVMHETPKAPKSLEDTGVSQALLSSLLLKFMYIEQRETIAELMPALKLPYNVVKQLFEDVAARELVQILGATGGSGAVAIGEVRYSLTQRGRDAATEALERNLYVGPAPVSLAAFQEQIVKQRITNESLDESDIRGCFQGLVIPGEFLRKIGPAINAGRTILLYGPPGNGKTAIATRVADIFKHVIYMPYCLEVEGQIIQIYDQSVHLSAVEEHDSSLAVETPGIRREEFDQRWLAIRRPTVVVGGELSLEMLDMSFSDTSRFYEAPMHIKALGGTFIVDDFGRQLISPEALLNRWIVPMESRIDFFKLQTGKSFYLPFDELLIFSTNLEPDDLMDPAFLRRIPYKIELFEPSREIFHMIFKAVAATENLELTDEIYEYVIAQLQVKNNYHLAYYQPKFICDQVVAACKYEGTPPSFTAERVADALKNLYVHIETEEAEFHETRPAPVAAQAADGEPEPSDPAPAMAPLT
ncbi:MAG: hypothetical protein QF893_17675 [Alphaproteobacteria bacterium]|nr:hypothetical protein [Alphaproteobacteria bacterium]